jgi:RNA polymerase sigma factor (sigma-70 family)
MSEQAVAAAVVAKTGGRLMELTDQEWVQVLEVAERTALGLTRDPVRAEDVAAIVVERLLTRNPQIEEGRLEAYVAQMARNVVRDEARQAQRGRRDVPKPNEAMDDARSLFGLALHAKSPSVKLIKSERARRQVALAEEVLASLSDRQRQLIEMDVRGCSLAEIAENLGYANANVVGVTRHRIYGRLREAFGEYYSPSLFTTGTTGDW